MSVTSFYWNVKFYCCLFFFHLCESTGIYLQGDSMSEQAPVMSPVESGKNMLIHLCELCTNEKEKCVWYDTNWVKLHKYSVEYIIGEDIIVFAGTPEKRKLSAIGQTVTSRISGEDSLGYTTSFYLWGPCLQQMIGCKTQGSCTEFSGNASLCHIFRLFTRGSFLESPNGSLVLRAGSAGWTLLAWPLWIMIQYFEVWCHLSFYGVLHGEAEETALNSRTRRPGFSCQFCFWFAGVTSPGLTLLICKVTELDYISVSKQCLFTPPTSGSKCLYKCRFLGPSGPIESEFCGVALQSAFVMLSTARWLFHKQKFENYTIELNISLRCLVFYNFLIFNLVLQK